MKERGNKVDAESKKTEWDKQAALIEREWDCLAVEAEREWDCLAVEAEREWDKNANKTV